MAQNQPSHFAKDFTDFIFIKGQDRYQVFVFPTFLLSAFCSFALKPEASSHFFCVLSFRIFPLSRFSSLSPFDNCENDPAFYNHLI